MQVCATAPDAFVKWSERECWLIPPRACIQTTRSQHSAPVELFHASRLLQKTTRQHHGTLCTLLYCCLPPYRATRQHNPILCTLVDWSWISWLRRGCFWLRPVSFRAWLMWHPYVTRDCLLTTKLDFDSLLPSLAFVTHSLLVWLSVDSKHGFNMWQQIKRCRANITISGLSLLVLYMWIFAFKFILTKNSIKEGSTTA